MSSSGDKLKWGRLISIEEGFTDDNENVLMAKIFIAGPGKVIGF